MHTDLQSSLQEFGLHLRGLLKLSREEMEMLQADENSRIALVGNIGSSYWPFFSSSEEYQDGSPNPLDRWSKRVAEILASKVNGKAIFPFEGPPYLPFQQWANRAEALSQSPLGLMIHPRYGLWHSYRFGLLLPDTGLETPQSVNAQNPCQTCADQPCLNTCPVSAFDANGYDVEACARHLNQSAEARCHSEGCLARLACPIGESYRYEAVQHRFHLRAFLAAR